MIGLQRSVDEYLTLRRSLGFKLRDEKNVLMQFAEFLEQQGAEFITTDLAVQWAVQPEGTLSSHWARRLSMIRLFARHHAGSDPRTQIPPKGLLPYRYQRKQPYIYSEHEIVELLKATAALPSPVGMRGLSCCCLFGLLASTGMRMCEAISLDCRDVDLVNGILTVRHTKFNKTRLIPIHSSTCKKLQQYERTRSERLVRPTSPAFFLSDRGTRFTQWAVRYAFVHVSRQIGLRGPDDSNGPRLHDLRHTFAVNVVLAWYRAGIDVDQRLPQLATYLGHAHVNDTYWYLTAIPELLQWATKRLETDDGGTLR